MRCFFMTEKFMEDLINQNLDGFGYITNFNTYELAHINDVLFNSLSLSSDDYIGKKCYEVIHNFDKPCSFCARDRLLYQDTYKWYRSDLESNSHFLIKDSLFEEDSTTYLMQTAHDISSEISEINELKEKIYIDDAIIECAKTLVYENDFNVSITKLLGIICSFGNADYTFVFERNYYANISTLAYTYFRRYCHFDYQKFDVLPISSPSSPLEVMLQEQNYVYFQKGDPGSSKLGYVSKLLATDGINNLLLVPLKIEKLIIGVIGVINFNYNSTNFELMSNVATFVVNKLNTKYSRDKLKKSVYNFQGKINLNNLIISSAKTLMNTNNDVDISVNMLLKIVCDYFFGQSAVIFNRNFEENSLYCRFEYLNGNVSISDNWHCVSYNVIHDWFKVHENNGTVYIKSVVNELQDNTSEYLFLCDDQVTSFMATPLYRNNEIIGFLWIDNPKKSVEDIAVIKTIATLIVSHVSKDDLIKQLGNLSFADNLTGLYNRNFYMKYVSQLELQPRENMGIIFADVNGLKKANDNLGHEYGDKLVRWCGDFLKKHIRGFVFRIGGDEFVCFVENISTQNFDTLIDEIKSKLNQNKNVHISIGSMWTEYASNVDDLVKQADEIMYKDKQDYYDEKRRLNISLQEELELLKEFILEFDNN